MFFKDILEAVKFATQPLSNSIIAFRIELIPTPAGPNNEAIIYTRVSTSKQAADGHGLDGQYSACLRYAEENNIKVIKTIIDPGYSGKSIQRPGIEELFEFLNSRRNEIYVIAYAINRYSRDTSEYYAFKDDLAAKGGILRSPDHDFANKDPANIF